MFRETTRRTSYLLLLTAGCLVAADTPAAPTYNFTVFDVPGAVTIFGPAVSNNGKIAGYYTDSTGATRGYERLISGQLTFPLIDPNDNQGFTGPAGVNTANTIVGEYLNLNGTVFTYHGFFLSNGTWTTWDYPGPYSTGVFGINDKGDFCGVFGSNASPNQGFIDVGGVLTAVAVPGATSTQLNGINNDGVSVGAYVDSGGTVHGFIRDAAGNLTSYDYPGSIYTTIAGINDQGSMSGTYFDASGMEHGFVTNRRGQPTSIDYPGATATALGKINNLGWIPGHYVDGSGVWHGLLAKPGR
ncbi:MAG: hypothetical protein C5B51_02825 [Terriglobia bacterium]|nr:MAG: hypothetical protein C5B51_02825 [Terriglobia bacterium]